MDMDRIIELARAYREQAGLSHRQMAYKVGFKSDNALAHMDDEGWNPTRKTLEALRDFLPDEWEPGQPIPETKTEAA